MKTINKEDVSKNQGLEKKPEEKEKPKQSERTENIVAVIVFAVLILIGIALLTKGFGLFNKNGDESNIRAKVPLGNAPYKGPTNATVVIIAFSDYECPFCKKGEQTMQSIMEKYPDKIIYIFKNYPLATMHPYAFGAALAALCAKDQDKFWEYHDYLFEHNDKLAPEYLKEYAKVLGLDSQRFDECFDTQKYKYEVESDIRDSQNIQPEELSVSGTPTFFINGLRIVGAQPEGDFIKIIDSELKAKK